MDKIDLDATIRDKRISNQHDDSEKIYSYGEVRSMMKEAIHQALVLARDKVIKELISISDLNVAQIHTIGNTILDVDKLIV